MTQANPTENPYRKSLDYDLVAMFGPKTEPAATAFKQAYENLFMDISEYLNVPPGDLFNYAVAGTALSKYEWETQKPTTETLIETYSHRFAVYFYDLLFVNGVTMAQNRQWLEESIGWFDGPVMEFGSGLGIMSLFYGLAGVDMTSVEISEPMRAFQQWRMDKYNASNVKLEYKGEKGKYQALVSIWVLEHLANPVSWVPEAWEYLRPGGILVLAHWFNKGGGNYPMHLEDRAVAQEFMDHIEMYFERDPERNINFYFPIYFKRETPLTKAQVTAPYNCPKTMKGMRDAVVMPRIGLRLNAGGLGPSIAGRNAYGFESRIPPPTTERQHFISIDTEYFLQPLHISSDLFDLLYRIDGPRKFGDVLDEHLKAHPNSKLADEATCVGYVATLTDWRYLLWRK